MIIKKLPLILFLILLPILPLYAVENTNATIKPIKILLVPGHDNVYSGAQYGGLKEAVMNLVVASKIYNILKKDNRFEVYITRDQNGYTKEFADYFVNNKKEVLSFTEEAKKKMKETITQGIFIKKNNVSHNNVTGDVSLRLYGFNKWASDNNIDATIHVHFNDYYRSKSRVAGIYKGFAIYMPDSQFVNSKESVNLAESIFSQLHTKFTTSTLQGELGGLISDQKLIALGANNTLLAGARSVLIEYGYIYSLGNSSARQKKYNDMANLTAVGIQNYFFNTSP
ncbi:MAG: N-acetylmuramoyl-L-alanine amidase [bacterium]